MQLAEKLVFNEQDYLAWEEQQQEKHEYINAEVFAMGGARREHVVVTGNMFAILKQHLRNTPCQAYIADMKLRVEQANAFFYPDIMVSCNREDQRADQYLSNPVLVVEVLSDSTEAFDRGKKFAAYRLLPSLKEYVLIDIKARRVECFRRMADDEWLLHISDTEEICKFGSMDLTIAMTDIFEDAVENP